MSRTSASARRRGTSYPVNTWYVIATKDEVSRQPLARRALETPVVLYRTQDGRAVALEDRDAHRPYPLSLGRVDGDTIVSGYSGFAYAPDGAVCTCPPSPMCRSAPGCGRFPSSSRTAWSGSGWASHRSPRGATLRIRPGWSTTAGRRSATSGTPRRTSCCYTRTSPTSPTSRWWTPSSPRRCWRASRRPSRSRSARPRCRSAATTRPRG